MAALGDAISDAADVEDLRQSLLRVQRQLAKAKAKRDELAAVTVEACRDAVLAHWKPALIPTPRPDRRRSRKPEHGLLHATDWQGAKRTTTYDSDVMRARVLALTAKVARIVEIHRAAGPVRNGTLLLGGDMIEGLFNFPTQPFEIDATLFEQYVTVAALIVDVVRRLLAVFEHVEVIPEWGNHGRLGSKRSAVPRPDNADRMTYELARSILAGEPRLTWPACPADDVQRVQVGAYRAVLLHGDEIGRNGFASPATIVSHVARWQSGSFGWDFRDAYIGHYHTHNEWALPNGLGSVYQTGSTESDNRYAGVMLASSATPSQRFHLVDPDRGRVTAAYKVWLDD